MDRSEGWATQAEVTEARERKKAVRSQFCLAGDGGGWGGGGDKAGAGAGMVCTEPKI